MPNTECIKCANQTTNQVCRLVDNETGEVGYFEVALALEILKKKPRKATMFVGRDLSYLIKNGVNFDDPHLKHINSRKYGIVGQTDDTMFILDGNHRATKKYRFGNHRNRPFFAYVLTPFETGQVFRSKPPKGKTWASCKSKK